MSFEKSIHIIDLFPAAESIDGAVGARMAI